VLRGISGLIAVSVTRNTDPDAVGYLLLSGGQPTDAARGFPVCRGRVTYPAEGYAAMFGWTQMVRSTDSAPDRFEMDPIALYQQIATPAALAGPGGTCPWIRSAWPCLKGQREGSVRSRVDPSQIG